MQIVSVKNPIDDLSLERELNEIDSLIHHAKQRGESVIYIDKLSYQNHLLLIEKNYTIKKLMKKSALFSFLKRPKKYYAIEFPV
ncbi:hypothetical protein [Myroides pelagicus]|uniref:Uncharacterized protein n=1 Tax=Myroides pelagicus TaxID=270914 RepID=A0A7K1GPZ2_9FLAO|nr:hypothetical protein [Myroides pelagicus]MEC4113388.1 hypothetical protein [Myroides pelagicus]MTH30274.1 hypothetical protein [Myroides pelagicus]